MEADGRTWHAACWACYGCGAAFPLPPSPQVPVYERGTQLFCSVCFSRRVIDDLGFHGYPSPDQACMEEAERSLLLSDSTQTTATNANATNTTDGAKTPKTPNTKDKDKAKDKAKAKKKKKKKRKRKRKRKRKSKPNNSSSPTSSPAAKKNKSKTSASASASSSFFSSSSSSSSSSPTSSSTSSPSSSASSSQGPAQTINPTPADDFLDPMDGSHLKISDNLISALNSEYVSVTLNPLFDVGNLDPSAEWTSLIDPSDASAPADASLDEGDRQAAGIPELGSFVSHRIAQTALEEPVEELKNKDFKAKTAGASTYVDSESGETYKYTSSEYAPRVFAAIRNLYNIDPQSWIDSVCNSPLSGGGLGAGKSGSRFFFSRDRKYVIKTIAKSELLVCLKWLRPFYSHHEQYRHTLVPRFFGLFKIHLPKAKKPVRLIIMNNVLYTKLPLDISYDLKGSTCDRFVKPEKLKPTGLNVLKDMNLTHHVYIAPDDKAALMEQITADVRFMERHNVMDYSLLLAVHNRTQDTSYSSLTDLAPPHFASRWQAHEGGYQSVNADGSPRDSVFIFGIVDILQVYNLKKKAEHKLKIIKNKGNMSGMSAVKTTFYADRFIAFMDSVFSDQGGLDGDAPLRHDHAGADAADAADADASASAADADASATVDASAASAASATSATSATSDTAADDGASSSSS